MTQVRIIYCHKIYFSQFYFFFFNHKMHTARALFSAIAAL